MSVLLTAALGAASATLPSCSWDRPGAFPFSGDVVAAVDRYSDIPAPVRAALKRRMEQRQYDEVVVIGRDSISGKARYSAEIRDMHFGSGTVCRSVTRSRWAATAEERGLVYCEAEHCLIVPTVCRNLSRVTRLQKAPAAATAPTPTLVAQGPAPGAGTGAGTTAAGGGAEPAILLAMAPGGAAAGVPLQAGELQFEAPAAGPSFAAQADPTAAVFTALPTYTGGGSTSGPGLPFLGGGGSGVGSGGVGITVPENKPTTDSFTAAVVAPPNVVGGGSGGGVTPTVPGPGTAVITDRPAPTLPAVVPDTPVLLPQLPPLPLPGIDTMLPVPEPSRWATMGLGILGVAVAARRARACVRTSTRAKTQTVMLQPLP